MEVVTQDQFQAAASVPPSLYEEANRNKRRKKDKSSQTCLTTLRHLHEAESEWRSGPSYWSLTVEPYAGEDILLNTNDVTVHRLTEVAMGRYLVLEVTIHCRRLSFINIYRPQTVAKRIQLFNDMKQYLFTSIPVVMAGDFNVTLSPGDRSWSRAVARDSRVLHIIILQTGLSDVFTQDCRKPNFTYSCADRSSRIDMAFMNPTETVSWMSEKVVPYSDHLALVFCLGATKHSDIEMGALWIVLFCLWGALFCDIGTASLVGTQFITTFPQCGIPNFSSPKKEIRISGTQDNTNVTIEVIGGSYLKTIPVGSKITISVVLPESAEIRGNVKFTNTVNITSNYPITVLAFNSRYRSAETSLVYPNSELGTEHFLVTPKTGPPGSFKIFSVTASTEETSVEIHTKGSVEVDGQRKAANSVFTVILPPFHGIQMLSSDDLSGSQVISKHPVVVLSGHTCAQKNTRCNYVYEQLSPVSSWGANFLVVPLSFQQNADLVYVIAAGKTEVNYFFNTTQKKETMVAGQVLEIELSNIPLKIEASDGVQVTFFNTGGRAWRFEYGPFLMNIVDLDSYCNSYYLYGQRGTDNYAIFIAESSSTADIRFDGRPLYNPQWTEIPGTSFSYFEFKYGNSLTSHKVNHPSKKFGLLSVGIGSTFSYGSPATCVKDPGPSCKNTLCPPRQVCVMERGKPKCVKPQVDLCWASGDPHFRTWDNAYFDFMGTCTYTFATVCGDVGDLPRFTVQIKNDNRGNLRVSYVGQVTVLTGPHTIVAKKGEFGYIRVDNAHKQLPISLLNGTLKLFQSGNAVIMQLGNDMQLLYDWNHLLMVEITRRYAGKMCGMCGNYNQDPNDDFQTPQGTSAPNTITFGASWMVEDNTVCWHDCRGPCLSCPSESAKKYSTIDYCGLINENNGPFSECHAIVDPKMYTESCIFDVCINDGFKKISCEAVQSYAETCQRVGVAIKDWRTAAGCPMQCPKDSSYELCGRACPATCENPEGPPLCTEPCVETCQCNSGFVLSEGKCIPKASCGCSYNGFNYAPNQAFWNDTVCQQRCVCNKQTQRVECVNSPCRAQEECAVRNGILNCYPRSYGVCYSFGDPHYISFDGTKFEFQGTCVYQLTGVCNKNSGLINFEVWVQNQNRGNIRVSDTTVVYIKVYDLEIEASRQYPNKVMINKTLINLPFRSNDGRFSFYRNPHSVEFIFDFELKVTFDFNNIVMVKVPGIYANALCGLCGNFNGVPSDDLTPKEGTRPTDPTTFGKSWKIQEVYRCRDDGNAVCPELLSEEKRQKDGASECGVLLSPKGPFRDCHSLVDPEPYFKGCVYDYCILQKRQAIFCSVMTSYVMACQEAGGIVHPWRSQNLCPFSCPAHSSYEVCTNACPVTCNGLSTPEGCYGNCTEGCVCNNGFLLSGGLCAPISECGCNYNGVYYSVGENVYVDDKCLEKCSCTEGGIMTCSPSQCSTYEECRIQNGVLGCFSSGSATCSTTGYSHYRTFDNQTYDFDGNCSYVLAQSCGETTARRNLTTFRVTVKREKQDSSPGSIRSVTIEVYQMNLTMLNHHEKGVIQVNGVNVRLPVTLLSGYIRAESQGQRITINTNFGFSVRSDLRSFLCITVPSNYKDGTCGLCGNYNGLAEDDVGTTPVEINAVGNKWKVHIDPGEKCDGCGSSDIPCPSCQEEKKKIFLQKINCGIISDPSGPFAKCHSKVNPESYVKDCVSDLCQSNGEDSSVLCNSVAVYAYACKYEGVKDITWRTEDFCPIICGPHSHFSTCADMSSTTCASIYDTYEFPDLCDEGCECNEGYLLDGKNCIPLDQCGCFDNGRYYKANEIVLNDDCSLECTCNPLIGLSCRNASCAAGDQCKIVDGVRSCVNSDPCKSKRCRTKESCQLQDGLVHCIPDYTGTCWAWGDPHLSTFDGHTFDFQGPSSYVLSQYSGKDPTLEPFKVVITNDNSRSRSVSYVKRVEITVYENTISTTVGEFPRIRVNEELTNLPASLADGKLKVSLSGFTASVEADFGLVATFDWKWYCTIILPSSYYNSVSGLCGNFNQDPKDDQESPNGTLVTPIVDWTVSWEVNDQHPFIVDHCPGECATCDEAKKQQYGSDDNCGLILRENGPFRDCVSKVNPTKFFDACLFDVCKTGGAKNILCQSLEIYAAACLNQGVKLFDWRMISNCPKTCQDKNSHYNACGNACPASCFNKTAPEKCTKPCVETCDCNNGMIFSGDKCVPISSCGCRYDGRYYDPGQSWYNKKCSIQCKCDSVLGIVVCEEAKCKDSETCMMTNGIRGCFPKEYSTCIASGEYTTFDKKKIDFMGTCSYQLVGVTSQEPSLTHFTIKIQNDHRGNKAVSFPKEVTLEVYNTNITMSKDHPQQIKVNGRIVDLPYNSESSNIIAYISGSNVMIKTKFALTLTFDGMSYVRVILPSTYKAAVNGLCGNNNGDPNDDFTIKDGAEAKSPEEFGKHWKVEDVEGCEEICSDCPKYNERDKEPFKSDQYCGLLIKSDGPFSQCHESIDPTPFFDDCVFYACAHKGYQSIICAKIASYVSECQRNGSMIKEWRTPSFCNHTCPPNSHYKLLGDGCPVTCLGLMPPPTCVKSFTEGCYCDDGFVRSGDDCVPISECGCTFENVYYKLGQEFFPDNQCKKKCTCGNNGITTCQNHTCGTNEECKVVDGILGCHAQELGQCIAWGDPHYITFDNVYYAMQGACHYTLVRVITEQVNFVVTVENEPYGNVAVTKSLTVTIGNHVIHLERERPWSIEVNNETYNLPSQYKKHQFWINKEGNNIIIYTRYGITLLYDQQYFISIWVPSSYAGLTEGLCGNYNKNTKDEFRLPNGTIVSDLAGFAESWTVGGQTSNCRGCTGDLCFTCDKVATYEAESPTKCGLIVDPQGPFKGCHALVPPEMYVKSCVFDVCASGFQQDALCASLQTYASLCQEKGVKIGTWRDIAGCSLTCPANSHYVLCTRTCDFTCNSLLAPSTCSDKCYDGCECDAGYLFDGENCVTLDTCGCNLNGRYLQANESVVSDDCSQECTCNPGVGVRCRSMSCAEDESCDVLEGVKTCVKKDLCKMKACNLKETCQVKDEKAVCVPDFTGLCWAWGDPHFRTFDKKEFRFQGTCSYILSKYNGNDPTLEPYQIIIKNDNRGTQAGSFVRKMDITMYDTEISIEVGEFGNIRVNKELTNLPASLAKGKITISRSGLTAIVVTESGVTASFDWNWHATVAVPSSYYNAVSGLCGNFNKDPNDDQQSPNGTLIDSTVDWAASWKIYDRDPFCFDSCPGECPTCEENKKKLYNGDENCGILFKSDGPFRECIPKVSPNNFFDGCLYDACMNDGAKVIVCEALESYASTCMSQGIKIYDWRTPSDCPKICEDLNSHYNACGNACPATCTDIDAPEKCTIPCIETCECKRNMVLSGNTCVPVTSCGCQYNGRYYDPHQTWYNEKCNVQCKCDPDLAQVVCQSARCQEGETCQTVNGIQGCYPTDYSTCIASHPHYTTFDKNKVYFTGTCIYQLVSVTSENPSLTNFTIKVHNDHRGNKAVTFTKDVILDVYNTTITMSKDHPQQIKVDGCFMNLPYYYDSRKLIFYISGAHTVLKTDFGMTLSYDGSSSVIVQLPETYKWAVNGLCGNNNGDPEDDFLLQKGTEARSPEEFGTHWKVAEVEACEDSCLDCPKCGEADKEVYKSDQYCGLLIKPDGPFSQCHESIDPTTFFDDCVFDACAYKGLQSFICASIASYVSECQRNGSLIKKWRTPSFCEFTCPPNSHYKLLGDGCPVTCLGLMPPPTCVKSFTEGCYCNDGFVRSGDKCVPIADCGCTFESVYYKLGQEFFPDNQCKKKCTCGNNGITTCQNHTCGTNEECKVVDGILGCHSKELGQCIAWGDPHYITFDNVYYAMQGTCHYTLLSVKREQVNFVVTVENQSYGTGAITKFVTVTIGDHVINLGRDRSWSIEINKEKFNVPYQSQKQDYWINQEGTNIIIQTIYGFKVLLDQQYYVLVWAPSSYAGLTEGLCGNYNKNSTDEFRLPNGTIVTDLPLFAESWMVGRDGAICRGCSGSQCPTCWGSAAIEANSSTKCGMIADPQGPFKDCHAFIPPERFAESCVFDICAGRGGQDALCASLKAYTALCQEKGARVQSWRNVVGCSFTCPANSHYSPCMKTCGITCYGLLAPSTCTNQCYEGCECDPGYVFDGNSCVTIDQCGCLHDGRYLKVNESVHNEECSQKCTCDPKLGLTCYNWTCASDEKCQLLDGVRSCVSTDPCKKKMCRLKETCKVQDDKAVCEPDYTGLCWAWGDPHFHTFDGKDFNFEGTCSYILAKYSGDDPTLEPFQVIIKNDNRGSQAASFVRKTDITMYCTKISVQVGEFPKIQVEEELTNLPVSLCGGKMNVSRSGLTAVIKTKSGVVITFDWNWHATVTIPSSYHNAVSGLCGNFNQDPNDDQQSPDHTLVNSTIDWASSWKVYDRDPFCFDSCTGQCPTCEQRKKIIYGGDDNCGILFKRDGPFRECIPEVSPNKFFDACLFDACMNDGAKTFLCQTLESYASRCMSQGIKIYDWRTLSSCPKVCEDKNSHYNACGNACPASCSDRNAPAKCTNPCIETCECNKNMVFSGNTCVSISSCGCQYNGRYFEPYESWLNEKCSVLCKCDPILGIMNCQETSCKDSETCKVVNGIRGCYPTGYTTCVASGDPHYQTFDGRRIPYMGSCIYQLVKVTSNDSSLAKFTINVENDHRGNKAVSFTKSVILEVHNKTVTMSKDHPQQIEVDGHLTELPYYHFKESRAQITAHSTGSAVILKTDFELMVMYDGWNYLRVVMPSTYKGAVNGLCGNNNGDPSDDLTTGDGKILKSPEEFGKHWKVGDVDGCTGECLDCPKCSEADKEFFKGGQYCGLLMKPDGPFGQCHESIDPTPFFEDCVFDACAYKGHQSVVCASISTYISECQRNGSLIKEWRTQSFCKLICPSNSHYELSGNGCPSTCYGLMSPLICEKSPTEGCYCDDGFIRSGQDCVPVAECGCVVDNTYYKLGQEFFRDGLCQKKCICETHGITTCHNHTCGANEECKTKDGILGCHAKELGQCIVWGDHHYITFDNLYYAMQGTCLYTLIRMNNSQVIFEVTVENEPYRNFTVTKSVAVTVGNHVIRLDRGRIWSIEVNREKYNIPCKSQKKEYWINQEGNNVIIQTINGFRVLFDQQYYVSVLVPSSYAGLTEGLCGNYNKDSKDDFRLPNGTIATDLSLFAESWTVARDGSTCRGCSGSQCPTCGGAAKTEANSPTKCGMIANPQGPFKHCHDLVAPARYVQSCVLDVCAGQGGQDALCASLQTYTALCQEKGANVEPWRTNISCSLSCQANSHYEMCTRTCDFTCNSLLAPSTCSDKCYEGCQCDSGYMFDGEKCVTVDNCGCNYNGRYVKAGDSVVTEDCGQRCTCQSGVFSCVNLTCSENEICQLREGVRGCQPLESQCTLRSNHNFITFDGVSGQFPLDGSYVMSSSCGKDEKNQFMVVVEMKQCGSSREGKALQIFTSQGLLSVNGHLDIWLNGWELEAPRDLGNGSVKIQKSESETTIQLYSQITVIFKRNGEIQITAKEQVSGKICGPCGNFNRDANDDLILKSGEASADISFTARSWIAKHLSPCSV
ncbi:IgGFc-binding protein-like [Bufo bufo]|uniref:IgGFc-binding protein-like n=1 Tax=Bufo bufo TaxID=8384 RepID=UPI001ABE6932|nr:IgGFc-binding protein-like [Bufo bufo]